MTSRGARKTPDFPAPPLPYFSRSPGLKRARPERSPGQPGPTPPFIRKCRPPSPPPKPETRANPGRRRGKLSARTHVGLREALAPRGRGNRKGRSRELAGAGAKSRPPRGGSGTAPAGSARGSLAARARARPRALRRVPVPGVAPRAVRGWSRRRNGGEDRPGKEGWRDEEDRAAEGAGLQYSRCIAEKGSALQCISMGRQRKGKKSAEAAVSPLKLNFKT